MFLYFETEFIAFFSEKKNNTKAQIWDK